MSVKPIPEGYHSVTPYLIVRGGAAAIDFYSKAFGAVELFRFPAPDGKIGHAEIKIGDSPIMLADEYPDMGYHSPLSIGGSAVSLMIYVEDVDAVFEQAVRAGAKVTMPLDDMFWGDRYGKLEDPFGHHWSIGTHVRDVSPEEMRKAMEQMGS